MNNNIHFYENCEALDKKWVLCSVIDWDEYQQLEELRTAGNDHLSSYF